MSQSLLSGSQKGKKQKIETGGPGRLETMAAYVLVSTSVIRSSKIPSTWRTEVFLSAPASAGLCAGCFRTMCSAAATSLEWGQAAATVLRAEIDQN